MWLPGDLNSPHSSALPRPYDNRHSRVDLLQPRAKRVQISLVPS
jgi:hypothetical protein